MAINKIMDSIGNTLLDLTNDTVTPDKVLQGYTFHDKSGQVQIGTVQTTHSGVIGNYKEDNVVRFIDFDGTIIAEYSIDEAHALTELPTPPVPTHVDFLVFDGWNHTLEEVQTTTHSLLVGALYDTVDHKAYLKLITVNKNATLSTYAGSVTSTLNINWGDDISEDVTTPSGSTKKVTHTYATAGTYWIKIEIVSGDFRSVQINNININSFWVSEEYIGNNAQGVGQSGTYSQALTYITYGKDITSFPGLSYAFNLKAWILPRGCVLPTDSMLWQVEKLKYISFPRVVTNNWNLSNSSLSNMASFKNFILPENCNVTYNAVLYIGWNIEYFYINGTIASDFVINSKHIEHINIPNSTKSTYTLTVSNALNLKELNIPPTVTTLVLYNIGAERVFVPNTVKNLLLGVNTSNAMNLSTDLKILDLTSFETPPTLNSTLLSGFFKIKIMSGKSALYENATNWSVLYNMGMIEEATE